MKTLREEAIETIDMYLRGKMTKRQASEWATEVWYGGRERGTENDVREAISALFLLHDEDERLDTTKEELEEILRRLRSKRETKRIQ